MTTDHKFVTKISRLLLIQVNTLTVVEKHFIIPLNQLLTDKTPKSNVTSREKC